MDGLKSPGHRHLQHPLNLHFSSSAEETDLHCDRLFRKLTLPKNFGVALLHTINDGNSCSLGLGRTNLCLLTD